MPLPKCHLCDEMSDPRFGVRNGDWRDPTTKTWPLCDGCAPDVNQAAINEVLARCEAVDVVAALKTPTPSVSDPQPGMVKCSDCGALSPGSNICNACWAKLHDGAAPRPSEVPAAKVQHEKHCAVWRKQPCDLACSRDEFGRPVARSSEVKAEPPWPVWCNHIEPHWTLAECQLYRRNENVGERRSNDACPVWCSVDQQCARCRGETRTQEASAKAPTVLVASERERCARIVEVLANMIEEGAGPLNMPAARLRQAAQSIRSGEVTSLWEPEMQANPEHKIPTPKCGHSAQSWVIACEECGATAIGPRPDLRKNNPHTTALHEIILACAPVPGEYDPQRTLWEVEQIARSTLGGHPEVPYPGPRLDYAHDAFTAGYAAGHTDGYNKASEDEGCFVADAIGTEEAFKAWVADPSRNASETPPTDKA